MEIENHDDGGVTIKPDPAVCEAGKSPDYTVMISTSVGGQKVDLVEGEDLAVDLPGLGTVAMIRVEDYDGGE